MQVNNTGGTTIAATAAPPGATDNELPTLLESAAMLLGASLVLIMSRSKAVSRTAGR